MGEISGLKLMETFFISHGPATWCTDDNIPATDFLKSFQKNVFKLRPSAILVISAHWHTTYPTVNVISSGNNDTIYDFNDDEELPESVYQLKYPAPGAPELAKRVKQLLMASSNFEQVDEDEEHGLDYGAWVPLMLMYPEADIPVCQLSVQPDKDATYHYNLGKILSSLKDEGVLIFGSGAATHNFTDPESQNVDGFVTPWATEFFDWLKQALHDGRYEDVNKYEEKAPHAKLAHPTPEHFYPLHVAIGAAGESSKAEVIHDSWSTATLSDASFKFTQQD